MRILPSIALLTLGLSLDLRAAGELDATFNPNVNGEIKALALTPDGKIVIGGAFTAVGQSETNRIAQLLPDGRRDSSWGSKTAGAPQSCVVMADGSVLVADPVSSTRTSIYRLSSNGSGDQSFKSIQTSGPAVQGMALNEDGNLLVAGGFYSVNDVSSWGFSIVGMDGVVRKHPISNLGKEKTVFTLLPQVNRGVLLGGSFTQINDKTRYHLAKIGLSGALDGAFAPLLTVGGNTSVLCLARTPFDGEFLAGGSFTQTLDGKVISTCLSRYSASGMLDTSFKPIFSHPTKTPKITSLAVQADGRIIVAGDFTGVNGVGRKGLARLYSNGTNDGSFVASAEGVTGLALQADGKVIITGNFLEVNGVPRNRIARLHNDSVVDRTTIRQDAVSWAPLSAMPLCDLASIETSIDGGVTWQSAGNMRSASGVWIASGLDLPVSGILRILGRTSSGLQNGSSGLVQKKVTYSFSPEIDVREWFPVGGGTISLTNGQTTPLDYGEIRQGTPVSKTLQIYNRGTSKLTVTGLQLPPGFTCLDLPTLPTTVGPTKILAVRVQADATALGSFGGTVVVSNDDANEGTFEFPVTALVTGPEIMVRVEEGELSNGQEEPISFAQGYQGTQQLREPLAILNLGTSVLNVSAVSATEGFTVDKPQPFLLQPGESRAIQVGPDQSIAGTLTGYLEVYSDDFDEPVFRVPLAATVLNPLVTKVVNTKTTLNRKSGLREQKLRIINTTKVAMVGGFRVIVRGLPEGVVVRNASEVLPDGSVVIEVHQALAPGGKFVLVLEYEVPKESPVVIYPQLTTEVIVNVPKAAAAARAVVAEPDPVLEVEKCERTPEGDFALTFSSVPGRLYQVEYSADGMDWKASTPTRAAGSVVLWVDSGLPHTECAPKDAPKRLYRVRELNE